MEGARYLEDGRLTIFKRSGIFYARIRTTASSKYIWRSLKTTNEQTAIDSGRRLLFQLEQRADQDLPPKSKLFSAVIDDYIRYRERDHRHGKTSAGMLKQIIRVAKFWREYCGDLPVEAVDDKVMRDFIPWRRDYYSTNRTLTASKCNTNRRQGLDRHWAQGHAPRPIAHGYLELRYPTLRPISNKPTLFRSALTA
jgi:hypothetical protein